MQPTALSRALLLVVSFVRVSSSVSFVVSAVRRLMRHSWAARLIQEIGDA
jgi:hypothetical protein